MVRKSSLLFVLVCLYAGPAFSLDSNSVKKASGKSQFSVSAGGCIFYNDMFDIFERGAYSYYGADPWVGDDQFYNNSGFGIGGYFDVTYLEIGLDFIFGSFKPGKTTYTGSYELKSTHFGFSLPGKYPVAPGRMTAYPLPGIDYQIFVSGEAIGGGSGNGEIDRDSLVDEDWYDIFSIPVGVGMDYNLNERLYLRDEVLMNFKLDGSREEYLRNEAKRNKISLSLCSSSGRDQSWYRLQTGRRFKSGRRRGKRQEMIGKPWTGYREFTLKSGGRRRFTTEAGNIVPKTQVPSP